MIGDTPHDVRCGKEIESRTVAVASGTYSVDELAAEDAWLVLESPPGPARFCELDARPAEDAAGGAPVLAGRT